MKLNTYPLDNNKTEKDFQKVKNSKLQRFCFWLEVVGVRVWAGVHGVGASSVNRWGSQSGQLRKGPC